MKNKTFFSYATVAPISGHSYKAIKEFLDEFYTVGPPEVLYKYDPMYEDLSKEAAKLLNCDPDEVTYIKNTSEGISIASEALPLDQGDEVLVMGNEYPANLLPWLKKKKDGITVTVVGGSDSEKGFQKLLDSIGPRTKAISISHIQCYDGYLLDLAKISSICREKDIFLVLDAVQSVGVRKIDLQATPVDFLICGGQKYLQAGMGIGLMYVNKDILPKLRDTKVGIRSMQRFDNNSYELKQTAHRFQDGTQNVAGIVSLIAALRHVNELGIDEIQAKNLELLKAIKEIMKQYDIPFIDHSEQGNIIAIQVSDPQGLTEYLKEHSVYIKPMKDVARLSFIHESQIEDVEKVAKLISQWKNRSAAAKEVQAAVSYRH